MLRIATFNVENLFTRPVAMRNATASASRAAIEDYITANNLIAKYSYTNDVKAKLLQLAHKYKWHDVNQPNSSLVQLQQIQKSLFVNAPDGAVEVMANGRADWVGWFELLREKLSWQATYNKGRVICEVKPDILIIQEVENRPTFKRFNEQVLQAQFQYGFPYFMVLDGNDERGIDLGILSRYPIIEIRSHINDLTTTGRSIFSRDCPEFDILLPNGQRLIVLPNHFKSKWNGDDQESRELRWEQAARAHAIAHSALARSPYVLLGGDFNDTPHSTALAPLFTNGFKDVSVHPSYPNDRPGTYCTGLPINKIDYLIMSPVLQNCLHDTGIERRGSYHPLSWKPFDTVTKYTEEASGHHLLWADFDLKF